MDIVELIQTAKARIASNDPVFNEQVTLQWHYFAL